MRIWRVALATLVIFVAGIVTGALLVSLASRPPARAARGAGERPPRPLLPLREVARPAPHLPGQFGQTLRRDFIERLDRELRLTSAQRERIEKIMHEGQEQTRQLWERIAPQWREEIEQVNRKIRAELTSEQQRRFDELLKQRLRNPEGPSERRFREPLRPPPPAPPLNPLPPQP